MDENKNPMKFIAENSHNSFIECIRDGILYTISLMIVVTLANYYTLGTYIQDTQKVFIDYAIFGISICIIHFISDKISIYITSNLIMKSIQEKKKLPGSVFLLPWVIEVGFDLWTMYFFGMLSVNVMFEDYLVVVIILVVIRLFNGLIESIIKTLTRRGNNYD